MQKIITTSLLCATFTVNANSLFESSNDMWDQPIDFETHNWNSINIDMCDSTATGNILQTTIQGSGNTLYIESEQMNDGNINANSYCADISVTVGSVSNEN